jgi:hypothetical protein
MQNEFEISLHTSSIPHTLISTDHTPGNILTLKKIEGQAFFPKEPELAERTVGYMSP